MQKLSRILSYFNPMIFYYAIIYALSKIIEQALGMESVWQMCWDRIRYAIGNDKGTYVVWVLNIYTTVLYWSLGAVLIIMEKYKRPKVLENYKIQSKSSEIENDEKLWKVFRDVLRNQAIALLLTVVLYKLDHNFLGISISPTVPSFIITMRDIFVCFFSHEFFFYYSHRILHHRWFYHLHKQHHEYVTPVCITAEYAGVIEHLFSNLLPAVIGFTFVGSHITTALLWLTIVIVTTLNDHSGYHLPFLHSSELHDYHHLKFNVNFSVYGFLDKLHGTYGHFEKSKSFEDHRTLFTLTPVRNEKL